MAPSAATETPMTVSGAPPAASARAALATVRTGGSASCDVLAADVATDGVAVETLPLGLATVGAIGIRVDDATSAATGSAVGCTTGPDGLCAPELGDGLGFLLRDGVGVADGADDGAAEGEAEGAAEVVAVGVAAGAGVVALGAGVVGVADGDGSADESAGDGLGAAEAAAAAAVVSLAVGSACPPDPDEVAATVAAVATPAPDAQITATTAPAVMAPTRSRAAPLARLARPPAPERPPVPCPPHQLTSVLHASIIGHKTPLSTELAHST
jgi:hypothetical protein